MPGRLQFKDNETARRAMRAIARRVDEEIRKLRPESRIATVTAISPLDNSCRVLFRNDTQELRARMGAARPWKVGQLVRVGRNQRRQLWVEDVIGKDRSWAPGDIKMTGAAQDYMAANFSEWLLCDGSAFDPVVDADLFAAIGTTYGGTADAPLLPNLSNAFPRGNHQGGSGGSSTHTHSFSGGGHTHSQPNHTHSFNDGGHTHSAVGLWAAFMMNGPNLMLNQKTGQGFSADTVKAVSGSIGGTASPANATNVFGTTGSTNASGTTGNGGNDTTGQTTVNGTTAAPNDGNPPYTNFNFYIKR